MKRLRGALSSRGEGRGKPGARSTRVGLLATATVLTLALALVAAPGAGAVAFQSAGSFTDPAMTFPRGIAVDPSSGNVYVAQLLGPGGEASEPGEILRFDAAGTPLTPASMGPGYYVGVAVEQGGSHTVYGNDFELNGAFGTPKIDAFTSAGAAMGSPFPLTIEATGAQIASDSSGNIYVPFQSAGVVKKYTSAATAGTPAEFACTGSDCNSTALNFPSSVAVDADGNVYVGDRENNRVVKFKPDGSYDSVFYSGAVESIAVDPTAGVVLVSGEDGGSGQHVTALDMSGNVVGEIPTSDFTGVSQMEIAVNPTTQTVYVAEFGVAEKRVAIFNLLRAPTATTGSASGVGAKAATLEGTVNPNGVVSEECVLQYTTDADFQANEWANAESAPCSPQPFNEETDVAVSAEVSGLSPLTTYDYRVFEQTEGGTAVGEPVQFTTGAPAPAVTTEAASAISQTAATLNGKVDAEGNNASCTFEYGTTAAYGTSVPCSVSPVTGSTATAVSAALSGLAANTTYHFRVVAENSGGKSEGGDQTLTTLADTCATKSSLCPPPPPKEEGHKEEGPKVEPPRNEAAYKVCVKKAKTAYKKALAKAGHKHGKARSKAKKAAAAKWHKAVKKCAAING